MKGTLQYKDIHGRVWTFTESDTAYNRWMGETIDQGHTEEYIHVATSLDDLVLIVDTEDYLIESRKLGAAGAESVRLPESPGPESSRETLAEISEAARETERDDAAELPANGRSENGSE